LSHSAAEPVIVVDTSAVIEALLGDPANRDLRHRLAVEDAIHAPHLIDVEVLHVLRRLVYREVVTLERAQRCRLDLGRLRILRYPHHPFADRIWQLRPALTAYDAAFVALSEALSAPLITSDSRLKRASGHRADVQVYEPPSKESPA